MSTTQLLANRIRQNALKMVHRAKASHIGSALSITDILAVLYGQVMRFNPADQHDKLRDRFILSKAMPVSLYTPRLPRSALFRKSS